MTYLSEIYPHHLFVRKQSAERVHLIEGDSCLSPILCGTELGLTTELSDGKLSDLCPKCKTRAAARFSERRVALLVARDEARKAVWEAEEALKVAEKSFEAHISNCPGTTGVRYRTSVVPRHGTGRYFACELCGMYHMVSRAVFESMPGSIETLWNGN